MTRLGMLLIFAWLGLRHWVATWLRWIAQLIDGRNCTLAFCNQRPWGGCDWTRRPWPLPQARHTCRGK